MRSQRPRPDLGPARPCRPSASYAEAMVTPGPGRRDWEVRASSADALHPYPCRQCDRTIEDKQTFFVERSRPWIVVHTACIQFLPMSVCQRVEVLEQNLGTVGPQRWFEDEAATRAFLIGVEQWLADVQMARKSIDVLLHRALKEPWLDDVPPGLIPKPRGRVVRPGDDDA